MLSIHGMLSMMIMSFIKFSNPTLLVLFLLAPWQVFAGPGGDLNYINASPYDWKLKHKHSYQIAWDPPGVISAGSSFKQYVEYDQKRDTGDSAAEATYELAGSPGPAEFTIMARQDHGKRILVQYNGHLASIGSPENSLLDLGFDWNGAVLFALSGDGTTPYAGGQPPMAWMQATLPTIGNKTLRQISMPLSHDSGMSEIQPVPWFSGVKHNVVTQTVPIYEQLQHGARWFDIRPFLRDGEWYTGHFSRSLGQAHVGGAGRSLDDIVNDINKFNSENPGELIILELSHELKFWPLKVPRWYPNLSDEDWKSLYDKLSGIKDLWIPANDTITPEQDLTTLPLSTFIQPGSKSAVILRIPYSSPDIGYPAVREFRLPVTGSWSDAKDPVFLAQDQLSKLQANRVNGDSQMHRSTYTITQQGAAVMDVGKWKASIVGMAYQAHRVLLGDLWRELSADVYPNLIEVDNIHNRQVTALCMVINDHFASS